MNCTLRNRSRATHIHMYIIPLGYLPHLTKSLQKRKMTVLAGTPHMLSHQKSLLAWAMSSGYFFVVTDTHPARLPPTLG